MLQILLNGIVSGLLVALPAVALSLTYGVLNFPNFAIGSMITLGPTLPYFSMWTLASRFLWQRGSQLLGSQLSHY